MASYDPESPEYTELDALMMLGEAVNNLSLALAEMLGSIRCELEDINEKLLSIEQRLK